MSVISRYIATSYLKIVALCMAAFIVIYLVIDFLEKLGRFSRAEANPLHMLLFFFYKIPEIANQIAPLAVLMATLLTLGMLARHSEITAMRGCGISMARITAPILVSAIVISVATFLIAEFVIPASFSQMRYVQEVVIWKKSMNTFFRQQNIWYREENTILQARTFNPGSLTLKGITLWQMDHDMQPTQRIEAESGLFSEANWILKDVVIRNLSRSDVETSSRIKEMPIKLGLKIEDLKILEKEAGTMGFFALRSYCKKLREKGYDDTRYLAQLNSRISLPFASLVMAFLGIPFAMRGGRTSGIAVGIGISLGIGFSYFAINAILFSFGQAGVLPPLVSAWAANLIFAAAGVWLTMTVNR